MDFGEQALHFRLRFAITVEHNLFLGLDVASNLDGLLDCGGGCLRPRAQLPVRVVVSDRADTEQ